MGSDVCVDVVKYSHATGIAADNSIPWTHLQASNLFLVLNGKDTDIEDGHLTLRVVHGSAVLESINIADLVDRAISARQGSQQAGITPQIEQLPIFGITKDALLAFRYRLDDGQARRVQFRLHSANECNGLLDILRRRGMEFQQQRPRTARPGTGRPTTATSDTRPLTSQSNATASSHFPASAGTSRPSPFQPQVLEAGGLSSAHKPSAVGSQDNVPGVVPSGGNMTAPRPRSRVDQVTQQRDDPDTRPSSQSHRSYTVPSHSQVESTALARGAAHADRSMLFTSEQPRAYGQVIDNEIIRPSDPAGHAVDEGTRQSPERLITARPYTAASLRLPDTLEHEIPPPRELPFKRPLSKQSGSSRPSTAVQTPHKSCQSDVKSSTATQRRADSVSPKRNVNYARPSTASPLKRTFAAFEQDSSEKTRTAPPSGQTSPARPATAYGALASRHPSHVRPVSPVTTARSPQHQSPRARNFGEFIGTRQQSRRSPVAHRVQRNDSLADAPHEIETPPRTSSPSDKARRQQRDPTINAYNALHTGIDSERSLTEYAGQSREDRMAVLEEFIMSKIEDPAFSDLCTDMDCCWRRMTLGL